MQCTALQCAATSWHHRWILLSRHGWGQKRHGSRLLAAEFGTKFWLLISEAQLLAVEFSSGEVEDCQVAIISEKFVCATKPQTSVGMQNLIALLQSAPDNLTPKPQQQVKWACALTAQELMSPDICADMGSSDFDTSPIVSARATFRRSAFPARWGV